MRHLARLACFPAFATRWLYLNLRQAAQAGLDSARSSFNRRKLDAESRQASRAEAVRVPRRPGQVET